MVLPAAGKECGARTVYFSPPQEPLGDFGGDFDDLGREQAMRLTMHRGCRFRVRRSAQAEDLAAALVEPVFLILDAVLLLSFHVRAVRLRHGFRRGSRNLVNVHIHWHVSLQEG